MYLSISGSKLWNNFEFLKTFNDLSRKLSNPLRGCIVFSIQTIDNCWIPWGIRRFLLESYRSLERIYRFFSQVPRHSRHDFGSFHRDLGSKLLVATSSRHAGGVGDVSSKANSFKLVAFSFVLSRPRNLSCVATGSEASLLIIIFLYFWCPETSLARQQEVGGLS